MNEPADDRAGEPPGRDDPAPPPADPPAPPVPGAAPVPPVPPAGRAGSPDAPAAAAPTADRTEVLGRPAGAGPGAEERTEVLGRPAGVGPAAGDRTEAPDPPAGGSGPPPWGPGPVPPAPPPGGPGPYPARRLQRSRQGKVVAGVARGLGDYTGVDPVLFRVLFAVLTVFGGAGILLYLLGWLFLPAEDEPASPVESLIGRGGTGRRGGDVLLALLLVVLGLVFAGILASGDAGDVVLCLVVVGGLVLLIRNLDERRGGRPPAPPPPGSPPAYQPYEPYPAYDPTRAAAMPAGGTATAVAPDPLPVVPPSRERSILGRLTLSVLFVVLGVTAALDAGDAIEPDARHYLALAVGVLGLGLLVGTVRGRARGLVWLGIPLTVALVAVGTAEASLEGGTGDRQYRPLSIAELQDEYRVGVGKVRVDLTELDFTEQSVRTKVSAGIGEVEVLVPRDVDVTVVGDTGLGEAELFGDRFDGDSPDPTVVSEGPDGPGGGTLRLELQVGVGRVEVDRATA